MKLKHNSMAIPGIQDKTKPSSGWPRSLVNGVLYTSQWLR
jgi:hypothetical protein